MMFYFREEEILLNLCERENPNWDRSIWRNWAALSRKLEKDCLGKTGNIFLLCSQYFM